MAQPPVDALWEYAFDWKYTEGQLGFDNLACVTWHLCSPSQNERFNSVWSMVVNQQIDGSYCVVLQRQKYSSTKYIYVDKVYLVFVLMKLERSCCCFYDSRQRILLTVCLYVM